MTWDSVLGDRIGTSCFFFFLEKEQDLIPVDLYNLFESVAQIYGKKAAYKGPRGDEMDWMIYWLPPVVNFLILHCIDFVNCFCHICPFCLWELVGLKIELGVD